MKKNLSKIYTIVVLIALVLLGAWSAWDVYQLRTSNSEAVRLNIAEIKKTIENSHNNGTTFNDEEFFKVIRSLFAENPELEILTIFSHDEDVGIEYHYNRGEEIQLLNLNESNPLGMKDLPEYKYNQLMKTKLTGALNAAGQTGLDLDLIYQVVDRKVVYDILIRILIVVIILFFTTLFMIFAVSKKRDSNELPIEDDQFEDESSTDDDMSLDWDESGFDDNSFDNSSVEIPAFDDLNSDDDHFGDLDLDSTDDGFGELNLDDTDDFGDLNLDGNIDDLGDLSSDSNDIDNASFDDVTDDFDSMSFDDADAESSELDNLSLDDPLDDFDDLGLDADIPEEEDLLAMDHELSPTNEIDDFDFDDMDDTFTDDVPVDDSHSLYSPKSGVGWEDFIEERVNLELERSAASDQDLVMGIIQCESLTEDNYRIFADQLKDEFNYPDMIFEYKEKGFALIVPSSDLDAALKTLEVFTGKEMEQYGEINVGISSRNGRLITGNRIFMEAENALHKAVEDSEKNIVGFRSDPDKFRDYLSNKN